MSIDPLGVVGVYTVIAAVRAISYVTLRLAEPLHRLLGRTGIHVISRILGLLVMAIGVPLLLDALAELGVLSRTLLPH